MTAFQTRDNDFPVEAIPSDRNEVPEAHVTVCYLAIMDQLRRTILGHGVELVVVICRNECKNGVRNGKGQVYRFLNGTTETERVCWLQGNEQREGECQMERKR